VCSRVLSPYEALKRLEDAIKRVPYIKVVAIAGPGEPLANEETFETLRMAKERFPQLKRCLSTNGLLLPEKIEDLIDAGVDTLTVTMNALDPAVGAETYSFVRYNGEILKGEEGARLLIEKQIKGLRGAVSSGIVVKINTVYIPGINDGEITKIAELGKREGAFIQNVIPLIPQYNFSSMRAPTAEEMRSARGLSGAYMKQMLHCAHCRADAAGLLGRDIRLD